MNFQLFYGCAAFVFGIGLMEVGAIYKVNSIKGPGYTEGVGIIEYLSPRNLVFLGENFKDYKKIIEKVENPKYSGDPLMSHLHNVAQQNKRGISVKGGHAYTLPNITTYTRCDGANSLTIQHANNDVTITLSDAAGCQALERFLSDQAASGAYDISLRA